MKVYETKYSIRNNIWSTRSIEYSSWIEVCRVSIENNIYSVKTTAPTIGAALDIAVDLINKEIGKIYIKVEKYVSGSYRLMRVKEAPDQPNEVDEYDGTLCIIFDKFQSDAVAFVAAESAFNAYLIQREQS